LTPSSAPHPQWSRYFHAWHSFFSVPVAVPGGHPTYVAPGPPGEFLFLCPFLHSNWSAPLIILTLHFPRPPPLPTPPKGNWLPPQLHRVPRTVLLVGFFGVGLLSCYRDTWCPSLKQTDAGHAWKLSHLGRLFTRAAVEPDPVGLSPMRSMTTADP